MRIESINSDQTSSANHVVFNIDKAPHPGVSVKDIGWGVLTVYLEDGHLHVIKPSAQIVDKTVLDSICEKVRQAEIDFFEKEKKANDSRKRLLSDIARTLETPLDTDRRQVRDRI